MALTRVNRGLVEHPSPVRWVGTTADRTALLPADVVPSDLNYFFFEESGVLYRLKEIGESALVWEGIKGAGLEGGISIATVDGLQAALDAKLTTANLAGDSTGPITVAAGAAGTADEGKTLISIADATDAAKGIVKLASAEEITAGTSTTSVITVAQLAAANSDKLTAADVQVTANTGISRTVAGNVVTLEGIDATDAVKGIVKLASAEEMTAGTSTTAVVTVKQVADGLALKLDKDFSALTAATLTGSDLLVLQQSNSNLKTTLDDVKTYVTADYTNALLFKGHFLTQAALEAAWDGSDAAHTPAAGSFAEVEETDSIWVWNSDAPDTTPGAESGATVARWEDTRVKGTVDASTQVIAGTGLTGGGALSGNVTLNADFGTTAGKVVEGNDARFDRSPVVWTGTSAEFAALTLDATDDAWKEGWLFVVSGVAADEYNTRVYTLSDVTTPTFTLVSEVAKSSEVYTYTGTVTAGTSSIVINEAIREANYIDLYLTGIHQHGEAYSVAYTSASTTITLSESVAQDIAYCVVVHPTPKHVDTPVQP